MRDLRPKILAWLCDWYVCCWSLDPVGIETKSKDVDDCVFLRIVVNNIGYLNSPNPEFFAKVSEEVSCDKELPLFVDKAGDDILPNIFTATLQSCPDQLSSSSAGEVNV